MAVLGWLHWQADGDLCFKPLDSAESGAGPNGFSTVRDYQTGAHSFLGLGFDNYSIAFTCLYESLGSQVDSGYLLIFAHDLMSQTSLANTRYKFNHSIP